MAALRFLLLVLTTLVVVAFLRLFRGPLHPGWSYRYEVLARVLRESNARGLSLPVETMRRGLPSSRIVATVRPLIRHERTTFAGRRTETFTPLDWKEGDPTLLYLHGGGYVVCTPGTHRDLVSRITVASGARAIAIDYRKAPEHPFPAAADDAEAAYRAVLESGVSPETLFVGGDSAGGGLTLALLQRVRDAGLPMPRGVILLSPWVDLEATGESIHGNAAFDYLPAHGLAWGAEQYLQGQDRRHPHVSALHADLRGFPPILMQTGGAELFLSENLRLAELARTAGVEVTHEIEEGMVHVFQAFTTYAPECGRAIERIGAFVRDRQRAA